MTQNTNGDSVWKRTALEWQARAEKAEADVARLKEALDTEKGIVRSLQSSLIAGQTEVELLRKRSEADGEVSWSHLLRAERAEVEVERLKSSALYAELYNEVAQLRAENDELRNLPGHAALWQQWKDAEQARQAAQAELARLRAALSEIIWEAEEAPISENDPSIVRIQSVARAALAKGGGDEHK